MQIFTKNGRVVMYKGRLAVSSSCCTCNPDVYDGGTGGGGSTPCDPTLDGCCCFGTGSIADVDQCECEAMQGTWRPDCSTCAATDGGNPNIPDTAPPAGQCNLCRGLLVERLRDTHYQFGCQASCAPGAFFPCEDQGPNECNVYTSGIGMGGGLLLCNMPDCEANWSGWSAGTFSCGCDANSNCKSVGGCGAQSEATSTEYYWVSGSACGASGGNFEEEANTTTVTTPGNCNPDTYIYQRYRIRQKVGTLVTGNTTTRPVVSKYNGSVSGICPTSTHGTYNDVTGLTCT